MNNPEWAQAFYKWTLSQTPPDFNTEDRLGDMIPKFIPTDDFNLDESLHGEYDLSASHDLSSH